MALEVVGFGLRHAKATPKWQFDSPCVYWSYKRSRVIGLVQVGNLLHYPYARFKAGQVATIQGTLHKIIFFPMIVFAANLRLNR